MKHHSLPTLSEAGLKHFKNLVYDVVKRVSKVVAFFGIFLVEYAGRFFFFVMIPVEKKNKTTVKVLLVADRRFP